jgi:hypothetical protein
MKLLTWPNICFLLLASFGVIVFTNGNQNMEAPSANCKQEYASAETMTGSTPSTIEPETVHAALDSAKTELALLKNKYSNRK